MPRNVLQSLTSVVLTLCATLAAGTAAAQNVSVTAANPNNGEQDTVSLVVKITGKNFAPGARSEFFKSGTTDPSGSRSVNAVVSSTEVDATIDIAATASIASFRHQGEQYERPERQGQRLVQRHPEGRRRRAVHADAARHHADSNWFAR
jgi:hypothetical protein